MFAKHLSIEDGDSYELVTDPEWERVGKAIKELNGKEHYLSGRRGEDSHDDRWGTGGLCRLCNG